MAVSQLSVCMCLMLGLACIVLSSQLCCLRVVCVLTEIAATLVAPLLSGATLGAALRMKLGSPWKIGYVMLFMVGLTASAALLPSQPSVLRSAKNGQTWTIKSIDYPKMLAPAIAVPWIGGTVAAGALPAVFVVKNLNPWYKNLAKPTWSPPDKLFAPVWSTLYALIGLSCALVLGSNPRALPKPFLAYVINATLNLGWAPVFFGMHRIRAGFFVSCGLLGTACWTALEFRKAANAALPALLLLPYIAWLTFATVLNAKLWQLNGASK